MVNTTIRSSAVITLVLIVAQTIRAFHPHFLVSTNTIHWKKRLNVQSTKPWNEASKIHSYRNGEDVGVVDKNMTEIPITLLQDISDDTIRVLTVDENELKWQANNEFKKLVDFSSEPKIASFAKEELRFRTTYKDLLKASVIGLASGVVISVFKIAVEGIQHMFYSHPSLVAKSSYRALVPALGGLLVGCLSFTEKFPPGLIDVLAEVDRESKLPVRGFRTRVRQQLHSFRKSAAAAVTLGTGCSLGPEGPCVELGMSVARSCMDLRKSNNRADRFAWNRLLLSCGAASGVAAGFNAPLSGVLFAIEVIRNSFRNNEDGDVSKNASMLSAPSTIAPIVVSSVLAALVTRRLVGAHEVLHLSQYILRNTLTEIPLYALLGTLSGFVAFEFNQLSKLSKDVFQGNSGTTAMKSMMTRAPDAMKPLIGGIACGLMGLVVPGILFVGYDTINVLLNHGVMSTPHLLMLLLMKAIATAISGGSGLVGGTFAPSLFLGAMAGASFHNVVSGIFALFASSTGLFFGFPLSDLPGYTMVGAASVLAALFRAPLTATMLLFELSHDYKVLLPLMVSAGIGSVVRDVLENKASRKNKQGTALA